ncbi:ankyrin repeat domain-containing protein [Bordetella genomosp. 5]|uniref:Uncharacterized protein n=1 Tax=Bordetella genomosp. 5 TaxID=1395608 RepID=A0A261U1H8_9BORD|nr:ankyrin repeat domain-containing protein [Bordetella genomosp. 5]OZI55070.1 hypothetical protein CAL25_01250 [Bordetella genomosp. 5]
MTLPRPSSVRTRLAAWRTALAAMLLATGLGLLGPQARAFDIGEVVNHARLSSYPMRAPEVLVSGSAGRDGAELVTRFGNLLYVYNYRGPGASATLQSRSQALVIPPEQLHGAAGESLDVGLLGPFPDRSHWLGYRPRGSSQDLGYAFYVAPDGTAARVERRPADLTLYVPAAWDDAARGQALAAARTRLYGAGSLATRVVAVPAVDAEATFARLHEAAANTPRRDRAAFAPRLAELSAFAATIDLRDLDPQQRDPATLTRINDLGFWLGEASQLSSAPSAQASADAAAADAAAADAVLSEVLRRDPAREPAYLNRADARMQRSRGMRDAALRDYYASEAREDYRRYCSRRLAAGQTVPSNIAERITRALDVKAVDAAACRPRHVLHAAIAAGDRAEVQRQLQRGQDPAEPDSHGRVPLLLAVRQNHPDIVRDLLAAGAKPVSLQGTSLLPSALPPAGPAGLSDAHYDIARQLLAAGAEIDSRDNDGNTLFMQRVRYSARNRGTIEFLVEQGADLGARNKRGESALQAALLSAETRWLVDLMFARGVSPDTAYIQLYYGARPVWLTPLQAHLREYPGPLAPGKTPRVPPAVTLLLDHGADVSLGGLGAADKQVPRNGLQAALESAAMHASPALIAQLRERAQAPFEALDSQPLQRVLRNWNDARREAARDGNAPEWDAVYAQWRATALALREAGVPLQDTRTSVEAMRYRLPPLAVPWLPDELYAQWLNEGADPAERAGVEVSNLGLPWPAALPLLNMMQLGQDAKVDLLLAQAARMVRDPVRCGATVADMMAWQVAQDGPLGPAQARAQTRVLDAARAAPSCDLEQRAALRGYEKETARTLLARAGVTWR